MTQLSFMDAVDAAPAHPTSHGTWWWHTWTQGHILPPGWRMPAPEAHVPRPRREAVVLPGVECTDADLDIAKAIGKWLPPGMPSPIVGIHEMRRAEDGTIHACLEAFDGGLGHVSVRDGVLTWGHVPGAGALVPQEGTTEWMRLPARESWDAETQDWVLNWTATWKPGDAIPPGLTPPVAGEALPTWYADYDGVVDEQVASVVWLALLDSQPPGVPFPFGAVAETHVLPDGALWACVTVAHDGGLCHVVLRGGQIELSEAPGAGLLVWREDARTWGRLPAKDAWDAEAQAWVPRAASTEAVSAPPDVEVIETSASDLPDVAPVAAPVAALQPSGGIAAFLHATHLATDASWKDLAVSLSRTTPGDVRNAVARHVSGGSLSAANAAALLARLDAAEAPAEDVAPEAEVPDVDSDVDPVYGTRPVPRASPDFLEKLLQKHEASRRARHERWKPLEALEEAGLATIKREGERGTKSFQCHIALAPAVSDAMTLWFSQTGGYPENVTLLLAPDTDPDSEIVRSVTAILGMGVTVRPAENPRPATGGAA
ncbi:hypothetical protein [Methylobacterium sp. Leaf117]|uniref:hypothetical protein n=1 Tax=Methylobacterium sp. Leaf117 TaxID=1736260 RepID=UPI0006F8FC3D|nr:hypothetical protein [Methylobacterium sp. Leaf117]KQP79205.1 hypothetical protein ASF57_18550 [Methylobacterium sp. Leaf117]